MEIGLSISNSTNEINIGECWPPGSRTSWSEWGEAAEGAERSRGRPCHGCRFSWKCWAGNLSIDKVINQITNYPLCSGFHPGSPEERSCTSGRSSARWRPCRAASWRGRRDSSSAAANSWSGSRRRSPPPLAPPPHSRQPQIGCRSDKDGKTENPRNQTDLAQLISKCKIWEKSPERIRSHCDLSLLFVYHLASILRMYLYIRQRYGNPDVQFLGTLKIKLQIYKFFYIPSKNMGSDFIIRVAISFKIAKLAQIWEPWKWKYFQFTKK